MRVPSVGLTIEERQIVQEGYRVAEMMMRNYQDPPSAPNALFLQLRAVSREVTLGIYRALARH